MKEAIIKCVDLLIPFGIGILLLIYPAAFTKKDLKDEANATLASRLKKAGILLIIAGVLITLSKMGAI